jgi:hypothetical protein
VKEYVGLALKYLRSRLIDHPDLVVIVPLLLLF